MGYTVRELPHLNGIRAFEAAARLGSFSLAGGELHVTPTAVSRMVQLLEARLGVPLFARSANRLTLTPQGQHYLAGLTPLLDGLARLTREVAGLGKGQVLTVGVGPTFAVRWLIPRLADFQAFAPDIEVRFTPGGLMVAHNRDWTCGIRLGDGQWAGLIAEPLFAADLFPVCRPDIASVLAGVEHLAGVPLLRVAHAGEDWPRWLQVAGAARLKPSGPLFENYGQALQAAVDGVGVAMGITPYVDDDLRAGRLVAPFATRVSKEARWFLVYDAARRDEPALQAFRNWLMQVAHREDGGPAA